MGQPINIFSGWVTTTLSNVYSSPAVGAVIIRSIIVCNTLSSEATFNIAIDGKYIAYRYKIKGNQTLVVPITDQVIWNATSLSVTASSNNQITMRITGEVLDNSLGITAYRQYISSGDQVFIGSHSKDRIIKSVVICNTLSSAAIFTIRIGSTSAGALKLVSDYSIPANETIVIPFMNVLLKSTEGIFTVSTPYGVYMHLAMKDVT